MKRRATVKCVAYELLSILIFIQGYRMCANDMLFVSAAYGNTEAVSGDSVCSLRQGRHWNEYMRSCENNDRSGDMRRHSPSRSALFLWLFLLSGSGLVKCLKWCTKKGRECLTDKRMGAVHCVKRRAPPGHINPCRSVVYG